MSPIVVRHAILDDVLATWRAQLGRDADAYRGHVYRVYHFARALLDGADDDALAISAVFHDLGIWSDSTFDYLEPSVRRAREHLDARAPQLDAGAIEATIRLHHKLTRCPPDAGALAEAFRRADLVDLSLGVIRFGLPRAFVRDVRAAFPNAGFHLALLRIGWRWFLRHPLRPLPMLRR